MMDKESGGIEMQFNVTFSSNEVRKILIDHLAETNCEVSPDAELIRVIENGSFKSWVIKWETGPQHSTRPEEEGE